MKGVNVGILRKIGAFFGMYDFRVGEHAVIFDGGDDE